MKDDEDKTRADQLSTEKELSEYQQRAERLAFENKMLRAVLDSMPDNISIKDLKGRYIFDNSGHARFLGATDSSAGRERDRSYKRRKRGWGRDIDGGKVAGKCFESATPEDC